MKKFFAIIFICSCLAAGAQSDTGSVVVHKDPRVDMLVRRQAQINSAVRKATPRTQRGFRLLVVNTTKRQEALDAKTRLYTIYPDMKSYLLYQTPYFKLKAGNFKTREEADGYRKIMNSIFPKGVFIINDIIEVKAEKETVELEEN